MGREIKRVPVNFAWPQNMVWKGYINPYSSQECKVCDGSGLNPETKQIGDDWYDFDRTGRRWCDDIIDDEVFALVKAGRLWDLMPTRCYYDEDAKQWVAWVDKEKVVTEQPVMQNAELVNRWSRHGLGHDAINRWICVETRAKRLGVYGKCPVCGGDGSIWFSDRIKQLSERWYEDERYDPPSGDGWQLWETVSEGSPISPVFATEQDFRDYLADEGYSQSAIDGFIKMGWAMSGVFANGEMLKDIESLSLVEEGE